MIIKARREFAMYKESQTNVGKLLPPRGGYISRSYGAWSSILTKKTHSRV